MDAEKASGSRKSGPKTKRQTQPEERREQGGEPISIPAGILEMLPDGVRLRPEEIDVGPIEPGDVPPPTTGQKALIVLQENTGGGVQYLPDWTPDWLNAAVTAIIDRLAETFEDVKTQLQAAGRYHVVHLLTDEACTRARLLDCLIEEAGKGRTVDLVVLGHGSAERLELHGESLTGSQIRSLLSDAKARGTDAFTLRTVYMCNCYGSTLGDDWCAIGAKVAVGSKQNDWMPEPMTTFFIHDYVDGKRVSQAAHDAYTATIPWYLVIYPPTPHITYSTVSVPYPCPTWTDPFRICWEQIDVPTGVDFTPHPKVLETELVATGDGNTTF
jgi:hypothetical protein